MIDWRQHRLWLGLLFAALVIGAASTPLLCIAQHKANATLASIQSKKTQSETALQQFQSDSAEAEKMKDEIDADDTGKLLAPVDRLRAAKILENRAQETHLSHFTYTLSPEEKISIDTIGAGKQELANSKLSLAADAPTDADAYLFLDNIAHTLPGHLALRHISLRRVEGDTITAANIHIMAEAEWLSNGAIQNLAGTP